MFRRGRCLREIIFIIIQYNLLYCQRNAYRRPRLPTQILKTFLIFYVNFRVHRRYYFCSIFFVNCNLYYIFECLSLSRFYTDEYTYIYIYVVVV